MKRILLLTGTLCLLLASGPSLQAGASNKKKEILTVRVHGEESAEEGDKFTIPFTMLNGKKTYLSIMPLLSEHEIKAVYPFRNQDGSLGIYLRLDAHGSNLLTEYSIEKMGSGDMLAVMVNGRQVTDLLVDAPVRDGVLVIPSGLTMLEAARLANAYPIIGQENSPSQKKKKQPFSPVNIMLPPKATDLSGASAAAQ